MKSQQNLGEMICIGVNTTTPKFSQIENLITASQVALRSAIRHGIERNMESKTASLQVEEHFKVEGYPLMKSFGKTLIDLEQKLDDSIDTRLDQITAAIDNSNYSKIATLLEERDGWEDISDEYLKKLLTSIVEDKKLPLKMKLRSEDGLRKRILDNLKSNPDGWESLFSEDEIQNMKTPSTL